MGAYHGLDQSFVFGVPTGPLGWDLGADPGEFDTLSAAMRSTWTQFAATGDLRSDLGATPAHGDDPRVSRMRSSVAAARKGLPAVSASGEAR